MRLFSLAILLISLLSGCSSSNVVTEGKSGVGEYTYIIPSGKTIGKSPIVKVNDEKGNTRLFYETAVVSRLPNGKLLLTRKVSNGAEYRCTLSSPGRACGFLQRSLEAPMKGAGEIFRTKERVDIFMNENGDIQIVRKIETKTEQWPKRN
jgi:hypothetical protein